MKAALVTAARRFFLEKAPHFLPADFDPAVFHISESVAEQSGLALDAEMLEWVLVALERVDVDRFSTFDELQSHLVWVVRDASRRYVEFWHTRLDDNARGVLDSLCRYIAGLSPDAVQDVTPLPYRRPLADAEMWAIWHRVSARWGLPSTPPASFDEVSWRQAHCDLLVTDVETFDRAVPPRTLRSLLGNMGVTRIWKLDLTQEGWSSEMDLAYVDTRCDWGECYLVALDLGWIMYVSHEAEFVAAGPTLLKRIRAAWNA